MNEHGLHPKALAMLRAEFPQGHWESTPSDSLTGSGGPDIRGTLRCIAVAIETKHPKFRDAYKARKPAQVMWANKFIRAGGAYLCTSDWTCDELRSFCASILAFARVLREPDDIDLDSDHRPQLAAV